MLRGVSQKEREQLIQDAVDNGDIAIMQAVLKSPSPTLIGKHSLPIDSLTEQFIRKANPDYDDTMSAIKDVEFRLTSATDGFYKEASKIRDRDSEVLAQREHETTSRANEQLSQVIGANNC